MLNGLRSAFYPVSDIDKARAWYADFLQTEPYFESPQYVGFAIGGFELGLLQAGTSGITAGSNGGYAVWGVDNIEDAVARAKALDMKTLSPIAEVGGGIKTADMEDPFGNRFGFIENPIFDIAACS